MLNYVYSLETTASVTAGEMQRTLFGTTATLAAPTHLPTDAEWPSSPQCILVVEVPHDSATVPDGAAQAWLDAAAPGPKLDILFRSVRMLWKSGRAYVQCPETLRNSALVAVLDYALLAHTIAVLEDRTQALGQALVRWQATKESPGCIEPLRAQLAQATQCTMQLVAVRPYCELPARTGDVNIAMRLRTEWLTQAQTSDALGLIEHQLEIVSQGLENQLQRTQEAQRGRRELMLGLAILLFLVFEFVYHLYA